MRKLITSLAFTALPLAFVTACSGNSNSLPPSSGELTPQSVIREAPGGLAGLATDLHSAGATFPGIAYNGASQPVGTPGSQPGPAAGSLFASYGGTGKIYYCLTGSGFGKKIYDGANTAGSTAPCAPLGQSPTGAGGAVDPLDFAGSDAALKSTEYQQYATSRKPTNGEPFEIPSIGGPIVYGYNKSDFPALGTNVMRLSRWTYCAIANGTITDWNDAAITKDNALSVTGGASKPITFYFRSDGSGTSYIFQNHLNTVCGSTWTAPYNAAPYQSAGRSAYWGRGTNTTWVGPTTANFVGASGNPGVIAGVQATHGGVGYAEGAYARNASLGQALLQNQATHFTDPSNAATLSAALATVTSSSITFGGGSDGINLGTVGDTRTDCTMYIDPSKFANPANSSAYPIVGVSYLLFYGHNNNVHTADKKRLINYINSTTGGTLMKHNEYAPLSSTIRSLVTSATNGTNSYSGKACLI